MRPGTEQDSAAGLPRTRLFVDAALAAGGTISVAEDRVHYLRNVLRLQAGADALFRGSTGLLSMDPQLQIERELELAEFDDGAVKPQ